MDGPSSDNVRPLSALLVEDDSNDQMLLRRALSQVAPRISLSVITDGRSAIEYLSEYTCLNPTNFHHKPLLVLLDVHLPRKSGWDVLRWMREQVGLAAVPVILWTSLPNPEGIVKAHELGADRYISKPQDFAGFSEIASLISQYLGD